MNDMEKADWVVMCLLVDATIADKNRWGTYRPTEEHVKSIMYLNKKYGVKTLCKAVDLIRAERRMA